MAIVEFARWKLDCDPEDTRGAHARRLKGGPEECGCLTCRNFALARPQLYPPEVLSLFEKLGIPSDREAEVYHITRLPSGLHLYGGFFHLVGALVAGDDVKKRAKSSIRTFELEPVSDRFSLGFTRDVQLVPETFAGLALVQLEFTAESPWVIDEPYIDPAES